MSLCQVTTDGVNRLQIVCGANNVRAGLKVAVAMVGAQLPNDVRHQAGQAARPGIERHAVLGARAGAGATSTRGSWSCADSLELNQELRAALDLDDVTLEVNATPNRGDCMSVFGIARDYAAAQERRFLTARVESVAARGTLTAPVVHRSIHRVSDLSLRA